MNTTTNIPAEVNNFYDRTLLMRATPHLVFNKFGQLRDVPRNAGTKTIKFRRYTNLSTATTALTEGVTPAGSSLAVTDVTATVKQYGDFVTVSDVVTFTSQDAVLAEAAELLGDQSGETLDTLTRDVLVDGTSVLYASTATDRDEITAAMKLDAAIVKKAVRLLKNNKAKKLTRMVKPSQNYNTTPIDAAYIGIVHPNVSYDLKGDSSFVPVEKYSSHMDVMEGEIGKLDEVRFIETTEAPYFENEGLGAAVDVYATIILGAEAYGVTKITGEALKNIVKPFGSGGTADPLDQRATSGWKATHVAKILNDDFMVRVESGVTA